MGALFEPYSKPVYLVFEVQPVDADPQPFHNACCEVKLEGLEDNICWPFLL